VQRSAKPIRSERANVAVRASSRLLIGAAVVASVAACGCTGAHIRIRDGGVADDGGGPIDRGGSGGEPGDLDAGGSGGQGGVADAGGRGGVAGDGQSGGTMGGAGGGMAGQGGGATTFRVVRVGNGSQALANGVSAPVFVEERQTDGALLGMVALPTSDAGLNHALTMSGSATSEGALSLSADGRFLALAGYAAPPGTASVASSTAAMVGRVVGSIDASGAVDTSTLLTTAFDGNNVRAAVTVDGTGFWAVGAGTTTGGAWFVSLGATGGVQILGTPNNIRCVAIFAGQLMASSNSGGFANVFTIGNGEPKTAGQVATVPPGMPTSGLPQSPFAFVLFDRVAAVAGPDTLYVADDRVPPSGGVQKWTFDGSAWTLVATLNLAVAPVGFRGLTGFASSQDVTLIASTADAALNRLVVFVDDGVTTPSSTVIATAAANMIFRGIAPSPSN
jgi:hypothetical protein